MDLNDRQSTREPATIAPTLPLRADQWVLFDVLGDGVCGIDLEGLCTFANRAALSILRYASIDELLGRDMHGAMHHTYPDGSVYPIEDCPIVSALRTGVTVRLENELLWRKDGTSFFAEYSSFPLVVDGVTAGSVITFNDLSLRHDNRRRHALQAAVSGILEGSADTEDAQAQLVATIGSGFGWDAGALWSVVAGKGRRLRCTAVWHAPKSSRRVPEVDRSPELAFAQGLPGRAWAEGQTIVSEGSTEDGTGPSRTTPGAEIAFPVRTGGKTVGILEFLGRRPMELDATVQGDLVALGQQVGQFLSRRQAEAALRDIETLKTAIMEAALDCLIVVDAETLIREFNPAAEKTFGQSREVSLGQELGALILPTGFLVEHLQKFARFLDDSELAINNEHVEVEAMRANGERFPAELSVTPLKVDGTPLFSAYMRDITERKRAQREVAAARESAEEANRVKSDFIANMSHELRTPLSAIIGYSEMLQEEMEDGADPAALAPDMQKIENNARHLLGLINDVLDLSKIESGKMEVFVEAFEVGPVLRDVASTVAALVKKKGNVLVLDLAPDLGVMRSDLTKLKQILLNLLSNAAKFTERGKITLAATRAGGGKDNGRLAFTVRDTGLGMTDDQLGKLFQRYSQADASTTSRFGGTGLGLSISRAFAAMLGGDIGVTSVSGQGSAFTIDLPAELAGPSPR